MNELELMDDGRIEELMFHSSCLEDLPPITDTLMGEASASTGIVLQHGFIGSNLEMLYLANHLAKRGYRVLVPVLPGHGQNFRALHQTTFEDWQDSLEQSVNFLVNERPGRDIYIIAHSMGGCLALLATLDHPEIKFVSVMATPMNYPPPVRHLAKLVNWIKPDLLIRYRDFRFHDRRLNRHPYVGFLKDHYPYVSIRTLNEVVTLLNMAEKSLPQVTVPLLVFYPKLDTTVWFTSAWKIYHRVRSRTKGFVTLYRSNHIVPAETDKELVAINLDRFINRL